MLLRDGAGAVTTGVNAGYVLTPRGALVVDALATVEAAASLHRELELADSPAAYTVLTHSHPDHLAGLGLLGAPVVAQQYCDERLRSRAAGGWEPPFPMVLPELVFTAGLTLRLGQVTAVVEHLGGHTAGSSIVYLPELELCFAGDLLFVERYPFVREARLQDWMRALDALRARPLRTVVPGHGPVLEGGRVRAEVEQLKTFFARMLDAAGDAQARGLTRAEAVATGLFPELPGLEGQQRERWEQCVERAWAERLGLTA